MRYKIPMDMVLKGGARDIKDIVIDFSRDPDKSVVTISRGYTILVQFDLDEETPPLASVMDDNGAAVVAYLRAEIEALKCEWGNTCRQLGVLRNEEAARRLQESAEQRALEDLHAHETGERP